MYCLTLLSLPPTTVTVFGSAGHFFDDFLASLSDSSVGAVTHRLGLIETACFRCLNVLFGNIYAVQQDTQSVLMSKFIQHLC